MEFMENKYVVDLEGLHDTDEYLKKTFSSKTRKNIKKRNEEVESLGVEIVCNEASDLDDLIELNKTSFGKTSSFNKSFRREIYNDILSGPFKTFTMSAKIDGKKENVSLGIIYKDTFASLAIGNNKDFQNLGHYMFLKRVGKAISCGCKTFDAGLNSLGWKKRWHLRQIPEFKFYVGM
jgi:predicted N-acyltransferase